MSARAFLTKPHHLPRPVRRFLMAAAIGVGVLAIAWQGWMIVLVHQVPNTVLIPEHPAHHVPDRFIVCQAHMSATCAEEAAHRVGFTVAWLEPPPGFELQEFVAFGPGSIPSHRPWAYEDLWSPSVYMELVTKPPFGYFDGNPRLWPSRRGVHVKPDPAGGNGGAWGLNLVWYADGRQFGLDVGANRLLDNPPPDVGEFLRLVGRVHFAGPPENQSSPVSAGAGSAPVLVLEGR